MDDKLNRSTLGIDHDAPFRIMLEKYLPQTLNKLVAENKDNICETIEKAVRHILGRESL